jgi:hypothetical protein
MTAKHINNENSPAELSHSPRIDRNVLFTIILGVLTAAGLLLLIFQVNRSLELRIEAAEVWSDYQVKIVKASAEEDPNLRQQYAEEQDVSRRHALDLKQSSVNARHVVKFSGYAAVLLLLGTAIAVLGLLAHSRYTVYLGLLFGIIGVGFSLITLV